MAANALENLKCSLEKFDGAESNYPNWRFGLRAYLGKYGLVKKLDDGTLTADESSQIYYAIATAAQGNAVGVIENVAEGDGALVYAALEGRFDPKRVTAKHALLRKVLLEKCPDVEECEKWLNSKITASNKLKNASITLEEITKIGILDGLPTELSFLGDFAIANEKQTIEELQRAIIEKVDALKRQGKDDTAKGLQTAATANKPKCLFCGKPGHYATRCWQNPNREKQQQENEKGKGKGKKQKKKKGQATASVAEAVE